MKVILSPENPLIRDILQIKRHTKDRFIIEGKHLVKTAVEAELKLKEKGFFQIERIFTTDVFKEKEEDFFEFLSKSKYEIVGISEKISKKISETVTPQGIYATIKYNILSLKEFYNSNLKTVVILDRVQDPGNVGTIIRASEALGADMIVLIPGTCNPFSQKVLRASAGSLFYIPVLKAEINQAEEFIKQKKLMLILAEPKAKNMIFEIDLNENLAVVFGNENQGISKDFSKLPHLSCRIPHFGQTESLNVAVSASIILYEILRNRIKR